jgi:PAS domain S-box-containing protein
MVFFRVPVPRAPAPRSFRDYRGKMDQVPATSNRSTLLTLASVVITMLLLAFVSVLLIANYTSQANLKATLLQRFQSENDRLSRGLSSFFSRRSEDLTALASSGPLEDHFKDLALGARSAAKQDLGRLREKFSELMDKVRIGNDWPFERLTLIDEAGETVVDVQVPGTEGRLQQDLGELRAPRYRNVVVLSGEGDRDVLLSLAYYSKDRYAGQILAWVQTKFLFDYLLSHEPPSHAVTYLMAGDDVIVDRPSIGAVTTRPIEETDTPVEFSGLWRDGTRTKLIAVKNLVMHSPFALVTVAPSRDVIGPLDPRGLLIGLAVLALVIIGSAAFVIRLNMRSLILEARLQESLRHEEAVTVKNRQLEQEIADRRQAEEALRMSEERYRTLIDTSPDIIYTVDAASGVFQSMNSAFEKLTGWQRGAWVGRPFAELIHPDDRDLAGRTIAEVRRGEPRSRYELRILTRSGEYRTAEFTSNALFESGSIAAVFGIARDVTERKRLEEQLRHAVKMEAVGQLAGGIAHDFNNMLSVIIGYCNFLLEDMPTSDPLRQYVELVMASAERAANLTQNLLTFSRKQIVSMQAMDLGTVVRSVEPLVTRLVGESIRMVLDLPAYPVAVRGDSTQVEQVIMNLAANARDAMPKGGSLTFGVGEVDIDEGFRLVRGFGKPGRYAVLTAEDTGTGMEDSVRERIFEPFFTTKRTGKGTGLGLSIVFGIVKQHHGYVEVTSRPGKGTKFSIYLPLLPASEVVESGERSDERPRGGTETILVAEDNEEVRTMLVKVLRGAGYGVIEAADGEEAVARFRDEGKDVRLLLCDVIMPNLNGKEAFEIIRDGRRDVRVVFISGYTADILGKNGISEQEFDFLQKPVKSPVLLAKVREVLDR